MYSQCPECLTRFRVTAAALRAARGTVRCGRCGMAFDALQTLSDALAETAPPFTHPDLPAALTDATGHATGPADEGSLDTEFHFSADDIEQVFVDSRDWQRRFGETGAGPSAGDAEAADFTAAADAAESAEFDIDGSGRTATAGARPLEDVFFHEPEKVEDITLEGERIVIDSHYNKTGIGEEYGDDAEHLAPPESAEIEPDFDATDQFETLRIRAAAAALMGDDVAAHDAGLPEDEFERQVERALEQSQTSRPAPVEFVEPVLPPEPAPAPEPAPPPPPPPPPTMARTWQVEPVAAAAVTPRDLEDEDLRFGDEVDERPRGRARGLVWGLGALLLALALSAQVIHYYRQALARDPYFGPPLHALYERLGLPQASDWNPGAYELRQIGPSDSSPTPDGRLTIRANLRNRAVFAQPMPLLRLELEDRYGSTVARRDFEPREYLKDPAQATRLLAAGATTAAEIAIADASSEAVGYRLDVCLRNEVAAVHCAAAAPTLAAP